MFFLFSRSIPGIRHRSSHDVTTSPFREMMSTAEHLSPQNPRLLWSAIIKTQRKRGVCKRHLSCKSCASRVLFPACIGFRSVGWRYSMMWFDTKNFPRRFLPTTPSPSGPPLQIIREPYLFRLCLVVLLLGWSSPSRAFFLKATDLTFWRRLIWFTNSTWSPLRPGIIAVATILCV